MIEISFIFIFKAEIQRQLEDSKAKAIIGTPKTYAALKEAVQNIKKDIKIICIQTDANESIPSGAINFADLIETSSKCFWIFANHLCFEKNLI